MSTISASTTTNTGYVVTSDTTGKLVIQTGATPTTAATFDAAQNMGLGVTPSAWQSGRKALQVGNASLNSIAVSQAQIAANYYYNGTSSIYIGSDYASLYQQLNGQHQWYTAPSGTAGNPITFTQAMTLDASGNLGVGTTSPACKADVNGIIRAQGSTISASGEGLELIYSPSTPWYTGNQGLVQGYNRGSSAFVPVGFNGSFLVFATSSTERARIDSSGNLLVGRTASGSGVGAEVQPSGIYQSVLSASTSATTTLQVYSSGAAAYRFYVDMGGTIHATSIVITAISDERLKENIRDLDTGLSTIMALKPRRYDWKEGKGLDKKNAAGFIAQEFEEVFPECVGTSLAGEDGIEYKNINYETLIPTLTKAIQEQQAIIQAQAADIAALKEKVGI